ncbi:unnamed protein product [Cunninghamella blakesleeana]
MSIQTITISTILNDLKNNNNNNNNHDDDDDDDAAVNTISKPIKDNNYKPLPSILIDFFAMTMCDLLPMRPIKQRTAPELMYFIQKITYHARISCHIAVVALIYIDRCKSALPKNAIGDQDTAHRIFLASLLVASKFLHGTKWGCTQQINNDDDNNHDNDMDDNIADEDKPNWLTNKRMVSICGNMYNIKQMNQLERSFLHVIHYQCWVDTIQVQHYLLKHRQELLL